MNDMNNNINDVQLISPFSYRKGLKATIIDDERTLSIPAYLKMFARGVFSQKDMLALRYIYIYGFISRHSLSRLIETSDGCKSLIKKLRVNGLIVRCCIADSEGESIADCYAVSRAGGIICKASHLNLRDCRAIDMSPESILSNLALNNFRAGVESCYEDFIEKTYTFYEVVINEKRRCIVSVMWSFKCNGKRTLIIPIPTRRSKGWRHSLNENLILYDDYFGNSFKGSNVILLPIVEDTMMACETFVNTGINILKNASVLFVSDYVANSDDIFSNLIKVNDNKGHYDIVKLRLD